MTRPLGDLQLAILRVLWAEGEATVNRVHSLLAATRKLAPTTVATMLSKLEQKGVVTHRTEGRRFVYRPRVSESEVRRSMVMQLTDRLFGGDPAELVSHLIAEHEVAPEELERLRREIAERESGEE